MPLGNRYVLHGLLICLPWLVALVRGEPLFSSDPMLRINTEMHTASISELAIDAAEQTLVTAGKDKTVKVWDLRAPTFGELKRTIRLPAEPSGNVGKVYAVDISPDGRLIAAGGWTSPTDSNMAIYIFEATTGSMLQRIEVGIDVTHRLAFSPDGAFLAACQGSGDFRMYPVSEAGEAEPIGELLFQDTDYDEHHIMWADWSPEGDRLVTTAFDGRLRLYAKAEETFVRQALLEPDPDLPRTPFGCAFHPDGTRLAVGYASNPPAITVLEVTDELRRSHTVDVSGFDRGSLSTVAWSQDGERLLAGGMHDNGEGESVVVSWEESGMGKRVPWQGQSNTINGILPLHDGRTLIGGATPGWAMLNAEGRLISDHERLSETADYRGLSGIMRALFVSQDGRQVGFAFDEALQRYSIFSLSDHSYLTLTEENFGRISEARTTDANMEVKNWLNTLDPHPTVNGHVIELEPHDMSRSLAIAPGGSRALLGTSYRLRCVDSNGAEVWNHLTPGEAFAVNISGDGRFGIVAFTDGTIRWFRMTDGTPLLAFFPLNDGDLEATMENQPEWVIWAPDTGHFRCSPNGAQLIGWQVNRGSRDDPDFYSADQLYDTLEDWQGILGRVLEECRPAKEIIRDLVAAGDMEEPETLEEVLQGVPEVQLEGIADLETSPTNWTTMTVRAQQTDPQIGITAIKLFVNGVPMRSNHPMNRLTKGEASQKFEVRLLRGKNEIRAVAYNRQRVSSFPATRRVFFEGPKPTSHLWVLGVGLEDYSNPKFNLDWCVRDISKSIDVLRSRGEALFLDRHVVTLSNDLATRSAIEEAFSSLKERIQPEDTFVFLYAGHGTVNRQGEFHLVTHDVPEFSDGAELSERAIPASVLRRLMNEVPAQKRVMLLDACHSGAVVRSFAISPSTAEEVAIAQLSRGTGTAILASSSADEMSRSSRDLGHGYFTWTFLEGLGEGKADGGTGDGKISVLELTSYINGRLPIVTAGTDPAKPRPPQFPRSFLSPWFQDFPIGSVEQP